MYRGALQSARVEGACDVFEVARDVVEGVHNVALWAPLRGPSGCLHVSTAVPHDLLITNTGFNGGSYLHFSS